MFWLIQVKITLTVLSMCSDRVSTHTTFSNPALLRNTLAVIQGHTDTRNPTKPNTAKDLTPKAIEFLAEHAFEPSTPEDRQRIANGSDTAEDKAIANSIRVRQLMRTEDIVHLDHFLKDSWGGRTMRMQHGSLGLQKVSA